MNERPPGPVPHVGELAAGPRDTIADVAGVTVGHATIVEGDVRTGVTMVRPHPGDLFRAKVPAAAAVLNGFGKSTGLVQVAELGTVETPIGLTNTFAVGTVATALIRRALAQDPAIGRTTGTVNPVVLECNDGRRSDIRALAVTEAHALAALDACAPDFAQGRVGAGTGMTSFGRPGGIGSASRLVRIGGRDHVVGALVLSNFGRPGDLRIDGRPIGDAGRDDAPDRGSVIVILATDLPLESRQLARLARRAGVGIARVGGFWGHGSGDIALAFSTARHVPHETDAPFAETSILHEPLLDRAFRAAAFATETAALRAIL